MTTSTLRLPPRIARLPQLRQIVRGGLAARGSVGAGLAAKAGGAAAVSWYLAGGAPTPIAVYQPKGAASLAASYVNLITPGTYNAAPGVDPGWDAVNGWKFNAAGGQYLVSPPQIETNIRTVICRFSDRTTTSGYLFGSSAAVSAGAFNVIPYNAISRVLWGAGNFANNVTPGLAAGVLAIGNVPYRNGAAETASQITWGANTLPVYIGTNNNSGSPSTYISAYVQAFAIWDTKSNAPSWLPAVSAAVALI